MKWCEHMELKKTLSLQEEERQTVFEVCVFIWPYNHLLFFKNIKDFSDYLGNLCLWNRQKVVALDDVVHPERTIDYSS